MKVFLRFESEAEARHLADIPFDSIETVIPTISAWSVNGEFQDCSGQFALGPTGAYFEVIVHDIGEGS